MKLTGLFFSIFILVAPNAIGQIDETDKRSLFTDAESFFMDEEYSGALNLYLELYKTDSTNFNYAFRIGEAFLNEQLVFKAIDYLKIAENSMTANYKEGSFRERNASYKTLFLLGKCYQRIREFDLAIEYFNAFKEKLSFKKVYYYDLISSQIAACERAREFVKHPMRVEIENIGSSVNTSANEVNSLVSQADDLMIFARKDFTKKSIIDDELYEGVYYKIFYAIKENGIWIEKEEITNQLGSDGYFIPVSLTSDGKKIIFFRDNYNTGKFDDYDMGSLYFSDYGTQKWNTIQKFPQPINSKDWESAACLSADGNTIYFSSDRKGSFGGFDLFESTFEDGEWTDPVNLGKEINTDYHDDFPFLVSDSVLFFTSEKHDNMGAYDIFVSKKKNGKWTQAINLGYPINTSGDELILAPSLNGKKAYFSALRPDGYFTFGRSDIYCITFIEETDGIETDTSIVESDLIVYKPDSNIVRSPTIISGTVQSATYENLDQNVAVKVIDVNSSKTVAELQTVKATQEYTVSLDPGDYKLVIESDGYSTSEQGIFIPKTNTSNVKITSQIESENESGGDYYIIKPIFFDYGTFDLSRDAKFELERLAYLMTANPSLYLEVIGHTDSISSYEFNKKLSIQRAKSVKDYLVLQGIDEMRFVQKGLSFEKNIAINSCEEGRKYNRRVEIRVIKSNNEKIKVQNITVPEYLSQKSQLHYFISIDKTKIVYNNNYFNKFPELCTETVRVFDDQGLKHYYIGNFTKKSDAMLLLNKVIDAGFADAEIIDNFELARLKTTRAKRDKQRYSIQLLALHRPCNMKVMFADIYGVKEFEGTDGYYRYALGSFDTMAEAEKERTEINTFWDKGSFVVSLDKLEQSKVRNGNSISAKYTLQLYALPEPISSTSLHKIDGITEKKGADGYYRYIYGQYQTYDAAEAMNKKLKKEGFIYSFVTFLTKFE